MKMLRFYNKYLFVFFFYCKDGSTSQLTKIYIINNHFRLSIKFHTFFHISSHLNDYNFRGSLTMLLNIKTRANLKIKYSNLRKPNDI